MKLTYLKSASVLVEDRQVSVLCDPWLVDGEYYGSWAHYPPCDIAPESLDHVDFIYISHIHPDHFSRKTLARLNRKIPVLIHAYAHKFLKMGLERLGFTVRELPHNERTPLKGDLHITILAADNCNPEICGKFFGCGPIETRFGSTQIDPAKSRGICLNSRESFDLDTATASAPYTRVDPAAKREYIQRQLATRRLDYETEVVPTLEELVELLPKAHARFERKRGEIKFNSETTIQVDLVENKACRIDLATGGYEVVDAKSADEPKHFVRFTVDPRLLKWLLGGPQFAHWNNAEIGSHIAFQRVPNTYERGLYYCMNFFHA